MKKLFALTLAVAMVLSLASVAFAATTGSTEPGAGSAGKNTGIKWYGYKSSKVLDTEAKVIEYGSTYYTPLRTSYKQEGLTKIGLDADRAANAVVAPAKFGTALVAEYHGDGGFYPVVDSDVVKGMTVKKDKNFDMNGDLVTFEIVKKKNQAEGYQYYLAMTVAAQNTTSKKDIIGTVSLKKNSSYKSEVDVAIAVTAGYAPAGEAVITKDKLVFEFKAGDVLDKTEDFELTIKEMDGAYFTVDTSRQSSKVVLAADCDYDADVAAKYPEANVDFFNGNGGSFNKVGVLTLPAAEGSFLYELKADGVLAAVKNATYDEYEEAFMITTRTLGSYVISDVELKLVDAPVVDGGVVVAPNPPMGAAA